MENKETENNYLRELLDDVKNLRHELGFIATPDESEHITSIAVQLAIELRNQARHDEMYYRDL